MNSQSKIIGRFLGSVVAVVLFVEVAYAAPVAVNSTCGATARSYSQDGLMAQWDGEENAGFGLHDSEATVWKNLSFQGTVWDMTNMPNTTYSWEAKRIVLSSPSGSSGIRGAFGVEHADSSLKQIETAGIDTRDGIHFATYPSGSYKWALGNLNNVFWLRESNSDVYQSQPLNVFLCQSFAMADKSADWTLYRNNAVATRTSKSCGGLGSVLNTTLIGGVYISANPKMNSVRLYSKTLTDGERNLNYAVDQIRFNGGDLKTLLTGDDCADSPAVVVIGDPSNIGVSSFPYGVTSFLGSTNGTVAISGARAYDDGVVAFADQDDPDNLRATCNGWTLKVGSAEPTSGSSGSFDLGTVTRRALVTWRFSAQYRSSIQSVGGGKVAADLLTPAASQIYWNGQHGDMTLVAVPDEGWSFISWEGDVDGIADIFTATVTVPNDGPRSLTARFARIEPAVAPQGVTSRSYVQSGLLAMWDGAENAGPGKHDPDATVWKNLSQEGSVWDLTNKVYLTYSWQDDHLVMNSNKGSDGSIQGAIGVNHADSSLKQIEGACTLRADGTFFTTYASGGVKWALGNVNTCFWMRESANLSFVKQTLNTFVSTSADLTNTDLYRNGAIQTKGSTWCGGLSAQAGWTYIGGSYRCGNPKVNSVRLYSKTLSSGERMLNNAVDQIRFNGGDTKTLFSDDAYAEAPAVVVVGDPASFGASSWAYGINPFEGSTNGTVTLSGATTYEDGAAAFPSSDDPGGCRAVGNGYSLKVGTAAVTEGSGSSASLGTVTQRALLTWKFKSQYLTQIRATVGGNVRIGEGAAMSVTNCWKDADTELTLTAAPAAGYLFSSWTGATNGMDNVRSAAQVVTVDRARTLTAVFVKDPALSWNSYATNGLAAQYDGEFNAIDANGVPYHDSNPSVWHQLVRTSVARNATIEDGKKTAEQAKIVWGEKSVNFTGSGRLLIRGLNSDPGGGDDKGWFSSAYLRACDNIAGVGTELCAFIPHLTGAKNFAVTANANVYRFDVNYSPNGKGTEWPSMRFGDRGIAEKYTEKRGNTNWDISYAQHVRPEGGGTNYVYRNGLYMIKTTNPILRQYYGSTYLGYFWLGSSNVNLSAFRVYTNTLDTYSIRWNSRVDRVRFLGDSPADVALDIGSSAHGTCSPALGSSVTVPGGVPYTVRLTDATLTTFEDGSCGYAMAQDNLRVRCGWRQLIGGPIPTAEYGDTNVATFTPSNVLNRLEWEFPTQRVFQVSITGTAGGQVAVAGKDFHSQDFAAWGDLGRMLNLVAVPPAGCKVRNWKVNGVEVKTARPRLVANIPVPEPSSLASVDPLTVTVTFERPQGACIILR